MDIRTEALVAAGEAVSWAQDATPAPGTPRGVAELNARAVTAEAERHPGALASLLVTAVGDFLAASAELPPDCPMTSPYFHRHRPGRGAGARVGTVALSDVERS
jgi:hypothetical protein